MGGPGVVTHDLVGGQQQLATAAADEPAEGINFPGYRVYNVIGDGNCFYRALAHQLALQGVMRSHEELRNEIFAHIRGHMGDYRSFVANPAELEQIARDHNWSGELEIQAAADALGVAVILHNADGTVVRYEPNGGNRSALELSRPLEIGYNGVNHFVSLIAQEAGERTLVVANETKDSKFSDVAVDTHDEDTKAESVKRKIPKRNEADRSLARAAMVLEARAREVEGSDRAAYVRRLELVVELYEEANDGGNAARLLKLLARVYAQGGNGEQARELLERALKLYKKLGDKFNIAKVSAWLAHMCDERGYGKVARELRGQAAMALEDLAVRVYKKKEDNEKARELMERAARLYEEIGEKAKAAELWEKLACKHENGSPRARRLLRRALKLYEQTGDKAGTARVLLELANNCMEMENGDYKRAYQLLERVAMLSGELCDVDKAKAAELFEALHGAYELRGYCNEACEALLEQAARLYEEIGGEIGGKAKAAELWEKLACKHKNGNPLARRLLERALKLYEQTGDKAGTARVLLELANNCRVNGDYKRAYQLLERVAMLSGGLCDVDKAKAAELFEALYGAYELRRYGNEACEALEQAARLHAEIGDK